MGRTEMTCEQARRSRLQAEQLRRHSQAVIAESETLCVRIGSSVQTSFEIIDATHQFRRLRALLR
jgi:hypothetical protein